MLPRGTFVVGDSITVGGMLGLFDDVLEQAWYVIADGVAAERLGLRAPPRVCFPGLQDRVSVGDQKTRERRR
jgi:hypothetical protein